MIPVIIISPTTPVHQTLEAAGLQAGEVVWGINREEVGVRGSISAVYTVEELLDVLLVDMCALLGIREE